ncbi:MAG: response regulator [Hydrococcus sp. Prado102]|jgi:HlyD family secretion protein|nr:response regulator [Hydrococcus sp. Prado102]
MTSDFEFASDSSVSFAQPPSDSAKIRILSIDDQNTVRQMLRQLLESESDLEVVGCAADGETALQQIETLHPDMAIVDIEMPGMDGLTLTSIISQRFPQTKAIVFSNYDDAGYIKKALDAGAKGYLLKNTPPKELLNAIRFIHKGYWQLGPVLYEKLNDRTITVESSANPSQPSESSANLATSVEGDWSNITQERIDALPQAWTRGLLYAIVLFTAVVVPWAMLSKVDETGMARGRLEPQGDTFKLDSDLSGKIEKIHVQEGQSIKAGQPILTLDSQLIQIDLKQAQEKLEGQKNRLSQLDLLKKQLTLSVSTQEQQNQSQRLEKQTQIAKAQETQESLKSQADLHEAEKLAQVNQAEVALAKSQKDSSILKSRYEVALQEINRYKTAFEEGVITEVQVVEKEDNAKELQRLYEQSKAEIEQNQQRLTELKSLYQQAIAQTNADINRAKLDLQEQQRSDRSLKHSNQMALFKIQEQLKNLKSETTTLKSEISQTQSQINSLEIQLAQRVLKSNTSGIVFQLPIKKAGAVVQQGTRIVEIAPQNSRFILRAQMSTHHSSFLKTGLSVKLKFDAYPFQDYGVVAGKLTKISPTTIEIDTPNGKDNAYQLEIELNKPCISKSDRCIPLNPGDTATAEVIVRQRRVIDFVLDPFKKLGKEGLKL